MKYCNSLMVQVIYLLIFITTDLVYGAETKTISESNVNNEVSKGLSRDHEVRNQIKRPNTLIAGLCSNSGEQKFITQEGHQQIFRRSAAKILRCDDGKIWVAVENGAEVPESSTFYFDENGLLLDICEPLFWKSGCLKYKQINCEKKNYCVEKSP